MNKTESKQQHDLILNHPTAKPNSLAHELSYLRHYLMSYINILCKQEYESDDFKFLEGDLSYARSYLMQLSEQWPEFKNDRIRISDSLSDSLNELKHGRFIAAADLLNRAVADINNIPEYRANDNSLKSAPAGGGMSGYDFPNPSTPMTLQKTADKWGGDMTVAKLKTQMETGKIRYLKLNRQSYVFCCNDIPNLKPAILKSN
ncbi:MAG: hypothetical protein HJJLKODD_00557 [Phycisphaerae bacterium]|nr:hypothetical protein [Phycisphaerae bacterium]